MDYVAYKIPQGEGHPQISGIETLKYAENYFFCSVPDITMVSTGLVIKYGIVTCTKEIVDGFNFYISTKSSTKQYKTYSSGQSEEFFDEDFDKINGVRVKRPMTDEELVSRYESIRWVRLRMVRDYYKQKFETLTINKTPQERATWDTQLNEARAFLLDPTINTPVLSLLAESRNTTVADLAPIVISAAEAYNLQVAQLFAEEEGYVNQLKNSEGDDIINVRLPIQTTIIPGDSRFDAVTIGD
jgi:hypothetical protein